MTYTYEALVCLADKVLPFHFEVALILRSSLLLNVILTNSEVWYGLKDISASGTRINLLIAALKPCCKAASFEYNKAYI